eukprot:gene2889-3737_t
MHERNTAHHQSLLDAANVERREQQSDVSRLMSENADLALKLASVTRDLSNVVEQHQVAAEALSVDLTERRGEVSTLSADLAQANADLLINKQQLFEATELSTRLQSSLSVLREEFHTEHELHSQLRVVHSVSTEEWTAKCGGLEAELTQKGEKIAKLQEIQANVTASLKTKIADRDTELIEARALIAAQVALIADSETKMAGLTAQLVDKSHLLSFEEQKVSDLRAQLEEVKITLTQLTVLISESESERRALNVDLQKSALEVSNLMATNGSLSRDLHNSEQSAVSAAEMHERNTAHHQSLLDAANVE